VVSCTFPGSNTELALLLLELCWCMLENLELRNFFVLFVFQCKCSDQSTKSAYFSLNFDKISNVVLFAGSVGIILSKEGF